jgi:hypothetical protein
MKSRRGLRNNMEATMLLELDRGAFSGTITKDIIQKSDSLGKDYAWRQNNAVWLGSFVFPIVRFHSDKYYLSKPPLLVQVEPYSDGYLVVDEDVDRHGIGQTIEDALLDYEEKLLGYFESLHERYPRLSKKLKEDLEFLNQRVKRN